MDTTNTRQKKKTHDRSAIQNTTKERVLPCWLISQSYQEEWMRKENKKYPNLQGQENKKLLLNHNPVFVRKLITWDSHSIQKVATHQCGKLNCPRISWWGGRSTSVYPLISPKEHTNAWTETECRWVDGGGWPNMVLPFLLPSLSSYFLFSPLLVFVFVLSLCEQGKINRHRCLSTLHRVCDRLNTWERYYPL